MIEVKGLKKQYGEHTVFNALSFTVPAGQTCALVGVNGAGKTTLLDILSGTLEADAGGALISGVDMVESPYEAKNLVGYMPAVPPLYEDMTPRRYLKFITDARGIPGRESVEKIDKALREARLSEVSDTPARNLTESARRMLSLAQANVMGAQVLLIDEPTAGLEVRDVIELRRLIAEKKKAGVTILLATRNLSEVRALCDRVLVLDEGRIVADASADQLAELELSTNELEVTVLGGEQELRKALSAFKLDSVEAAGEAGAAAAVVTMQGDQRADVSRALMQAGLPTLMMKRRTVPGDKLLTKLVTEQIASDGKEGEAGDESNL